MRAPGGGLLAGGCRRARRAKKGGQEALRRGPLRTAIFSLVKTASTRNEKDAMNNPGTFYGNPSHGAHVLPPAYFYGHQIERLQYGRTKLFDIQHIATRILGMETHAQKKQYRCHTARSCLSSQLLLSCSDHGWMHC